MEHRKHPRTSFRAEFRSADADGAGELVFESMDLSRGGAFLQSELLFEVGEALALEFSPPGAPHPLRAQARVAWVRSFPRDGEQAGMGVEFLSMADEDRAELARCLDGVAGR